MFCQKPMAHTVYEARRMADVARETGVATQVAVVNQATEDARVLCEWVWGGAIGDVREVINWSNLPVWPQALDRRPGEVPVPKGFDSVLSVGPSPARPYHPACCPVIWRGWRDFGTGAVGDMGCYSFDTIFRVLNSGRRSPSRPPPPSDTKKPIPWLRLFTGTSPREGQCPPCTSLGTTARWSRSGRRNSKTNGNSREKA